MGINNAFYFFCFTNETFEFMPKPTWPMSGGGGSFSLG